MLPRRGAPRTSRQGGWWLNWLCGTCCEVMNWCLRRVLPRGTRNTQCGCTEEGPPYALLSSGTSELELLSLDGLDDEEEGIFFHTINGQSEMVVVERHLCAVDLSHVLYLKFNIQSTDHSGLDHNSWSIVEHWHNMGFERHLEDHEKVLAVHREGGRSNERRFIFKSDVSKYGFFEWPSRYFLNDMVDADWDRPSFEEEISIYNDGANLSFKFVVGSGWLRENGMRVYDSWDKILLLLFDGKLYITSELQVMAKAVRELRSALLNGESSKEKGKEKPQTSASYPAKDKSILKALSPLREFLSLNHYDVYSTLNARNQLKAPSEFGICFRPRSTPTSPSATLESSPSRLRRRLIPSFIVISEEIRVCWISAMRLAKHGKYIHESYRAICSSREASRKRASSGRTSRVGASGSSLPTTVTEHLRARVAMDFTGNVGRIVEDPVEAKEAAEEEGDSWKKKWRPPVARSLNPAGVPVSQSPNAEAHISETWFFGNITREQASQLLLHPSNIEGMFLIRRSLTYGGSFVLSLRVGGKVVHTQIHPAHEADLGKFCYSLDGGATKFYDLLQLVQFYQLNAACLPTRLLHSPQESVQLSPSSPHAQHSPSADASSI